MNISNDQLNRILVLLRSYRIEYRCQADSMVRWCPACGAEEGLDVDNDWTVVHHSNCAAVSRQREADSLIAELSATTLNRVYVGQRFLPERPIRLFKRHPDYEYYPGPSATTTSAVTVVAVFPDSFKVECTIDGDVYGRVFVRDDWRDLGLDSDTVIG